MNNYTLGRGQLHFGQFRAGTQIPKGELYFGNTPELNYSVEEETLDHYSSDDSIRRKDESVSLQTDYSGGFTTDNVSLPNLAMFFMGESSIQTVTAGSVTDEEHDDVEPGRAYQLGTDANNPAGVRAVTSVVVTDDNVGTPVTFDVTDDYVVDEELGRVTIVEGGAITAGTNLRISYQVSATSRDRVVSKGTTIEGALRFISKNPVGKQIDHFMPWVKIRADGDFAIKGDEWQTLPFTIEILAKPGMEAIYLDGRPYTPAP